MVELPAGDRALGALLTGRPGLLTAELLVAARRHRIHFLLAEASAPIDASPEVMADLRRELRQAAAFDALDEADLGQLLEAVARAGVDALLFKGSALAQLVYPAPYLRPRVDTDILIRREQLDAAERVFLAQGWSRAAESGAELMAAQRHYMKPGPASTVRHLDAHWRISNARVFGDALPFEDLWARAVPVPALGAAAWAACLVDALLVACVHRVAHHDDEIDLLWLWDIHLLVSRLSADEQRDTIAGAARAGVTGVCAHGIDLVSAAFATPGAVSLASRLREAGHGRAEIASQFIGGTRRIAVLRTDLAALTGWRARLQLVGEHLFPARHYMRAIYPRWPDAFLWLTYVDRVARGAAAWFRRPRQSRR